AGEPVRPADRRATLFDMPAEARIQQRNGRVVLVGEVFAIQAIDGEDHVVAYARQRDRSLLPFLDLDLLAVERLLRVAQAELAQPLTRELLQQHRIVLRLFDELRIVHQQFHQHGGMQVLRVSRQILAGADTECREAAPMRRVEQIAGAEYAMLGKSLYRRARRGVPKKTAAVDFLRSIGEQRLRLL